MEFTVHRGWSVTKWVTGLFASNVYLIIPEDGVEAAVIDAGGAARAVADYCRKNGLELKHIILTHRHHDHTLGSRRMSKLTGARILSSELKLKIKKPFSEGGWFIKDGDVIRVGQLSIEVISTPGHTPGGITLGLEGALFTGDTLFAGGVGRTDLRGGDHRALAESLRRLMTFPLDTAVYPGHGPPSTIGRERAENPFIRA